MLKKTLLRSIILISFTFLLVNCSGDDDTLEKETVFNKLTNELSWSIDHGFDEVSYIQFFNIQNNKEKVRNFLYPSYYDCYLVSYGFVAFEHESDYEASIVTILENDNNKFTIEYEFGDGMYYHKVSLFEENGKMIKSWQTTNQSGIPYGSISKMIITPSNINPETDLNFCD